MDFQIGKSSLTIKHNELEYTLPFLWIRDNCSCNDCRIMETQEKRFMLNSIPVDLKPKSVNANQKNLWVAWPDGHETTISFKDIGSLKKINPLKLF